MKKGAIIGAGFWANFQLPAWQEIPEVQIVAVCDKDIEKANAIANKFNIANAYSDFQTMLESEALDFVDIITSIETHAALTALVAQKGIPVICQKPMAQNIEQAAGMLEACAKAQVPLFIHENFRWQKPIRQLKKLLDIGAIGRPFKARVSFLSAFPVFDNQPILAELPRFILTDIGSHILDICRYLFGEAHSVYCITSRVNKKIQGEDVATVLMDMKSGLHCLAEMSYATLLEKETFPQTLVLVEGEKGSVYLTADYQLKLTTLHGTQIIEAKPPEFIWADPKYALVHSSIVDCNRNILEGLMGGTVETTGKDNFNTLQLVWAAYHSADSNQVIIIN